MNLQPINPPQPAFKFVCAGCNQQKDSAGAKADLDGKAFEAYYCADCVRKMDGRIVIENECNGSGPHSGNEVRLLPHSNEPLHGNDILCRACFYREIAYRRERNKTLGDFAKFDLPSWNDLKVYGE